MSIMCNSFISLYLSILIIIQYFCLFSQTSTPFLSTNYVPFVLSCGLCLVLNVKLDSFKQYLFSYIYLSLLSTYIILHLIGLITLKWTIREQINYHFINFFKVIFFTTKEAYKKFVRVFHTIGCFLGLVGFLLGIFSLFCDQNNLEFKLKGDMKEMIDRIHEFYARYP